jgi:hypothetical protein
MRTDFGAYGAEYTGQLHQGEEVRPFLSIYVDFQGGARTAQSFAERMARSLDRAPSDGRAALQSVNRAGRGQK